MQRHQLFRGQSELVRHFLRQVLRHRDAFRLLRAHLALCLLLDLRIRPVSPHSLSRLLDVHRPVRLPRHRFARRHISHLTLSDSYLAQPSGRPALPSLPTAAPIFRPHWEKISHGSPAAVRRPAAENFFGVGVVREILRFPAKAAHVAPALRSSKRQPLRPLWPRDLARLSAMVFALWQLWHRLCRLLRSVNFSQSPLCGSM